MSENLDPLGDAVTVGNVTLRTPGLAGTAESFQPTAGGTRSESMAAAEQTTEQLDEALRRAGMLAQETIELRDTREVEVGAVPTRSTAAGEPALIAEVPAPGDEWGQLVLYTDEAGVTTWNFARDAGNNIDVTRGAATRTYVIRRFVAPSGAVAETRGVVGAVGKKLLKILVFPLVDPVLRVAGRSLAAAWERQNRPYALRTFTPEDYASPAGRPLGPADWERLSARQGRALLMVHGTFSRTHTAFAGLPPELVQELHRNYQERVFAFDHFTMSEDPQQNVQWLLNHIPDRLHLELDIICHSRGGLVSRVLAERIGHLAAGSPKIQVERVVFVAAPNAGTILTDAAHMGDLLDSYTNLLNFLPDNGVTEVLDALTVVARHLATATLAGLEGLQSMLPGGSFLKGLNTGSKGDERYYALAASYHPTDPGFKAWALDYLMNKVFVGAENDLVVPTLGVYSANGSDLFPIKTIHRFETGDAVSHGTFFSNRAAQQKIREWLPPESARNP